jgi:hypothetical protein
MRRSLRLAIDLALALGAASSAHATFDCATVTRRGLADPEAGVFRNQFAERVPVNASGDVLFVASPERQLSRLYLDPGVGPTEIVARAGTGAAGEILNPAKPFSRFSISDAGDLAFAARVIGGDGVFVREQGGAIEKAAASGDAAPLPGGGTFDDVALASVINASGRVAFVATVDGGPGGVFLYDAPTGTLSLAVERGAPTLSGRRLCELEEIALNDAGELLLRAQTKLDCGAALEPAVQGLFLAHALGITTVALSGTPSPVAGTSYAELLDPQVVNAGGDVAFRANLSGAEIVEHIFFWDRGTATASDVVGVGDAIPLGPNARLREMRTIGLTDDDRVFVSVRSDPETAFGIMAYAPPFCGVACGESILQRSDPPPADAYAPGAVYKKIGHGDREALGLARDGSHVALEIVVFDGLRPTKKKGIFRCVE